MSDWREGFRHALINEVVRMGTPVSKTASFYGWMDYDYTEIRKRVMAQDIDYDATTWFESNWQEFQGTFYEGDTTVYGIDMDLVLTDGTVYHWRYSGKVGELILALVKGA